MQLFMIGSGPFDPDFFRDYVQHHVASDANVAYVGVDLGAERFLEMGIPMTFAIGDFDSVSAAVYAKIVQATNQVTRLNPMKDETDMEAALNHILDQGIEADIHIFGALGGRVDHSLSNLWIAYKPQYQDILDRIHLVNPKNQVTFLRPGKFTVDQLAGMKYLSFVAMTPVRKLKLKHVVYTLDGMNMDYPLALISNEFLPDQEQMSGSFKEGILAVIQAKD
ncbi:thiamine diphosphokinase [Aerococcus kribbianus]|uniref:Thiamine diphosphokinase n=1 Tax=Aerococcus kribbianus TaxID=2999064 RepID=A0A9X3FP97_9LACT|nr:MULTISPECIES: thiamine diphosphokinase [unclassified Aerococcus]MCZ0717193.1 thiamine diphosphokinase [Aerococcus sp. YH-aer221]MCZ0725481.1 thiamine diphosphokinase [Aerococcus sp. YH-aer222]